MNLEKNLFKEVALTKLTETLIFKVVSSFDHTEHFFGVFLQLSNIGPVSHSLLSLADIILGLFKKDFFV
jgi:hypothetical protein